MKNLDNNNTFRLAILPGCKVSISSWFFDLFASLRVLCLKPVFIVILLFFLRVHHPCVWEFVASIRNKTRLSNEKCCNPKMAKTLCPLIVEINVFYCVTKVFWSRCCHFHYACAANRNHYTTSADVYIQSKYPNGDWP